MFFILHKVCPAVCNFIISYHHEILKNMSSKIIKNLSFYYCKMSYTELGMVPVLIVNYCQAVLAQVQAVLLGLHSVWPSWGDSRIVITN